MSNPRGRPVTVAPPGARLVDLHLSEYHERDLKHFSRYMQLRALGTHVAAPHRLAGQADEIRAKRAMDIAKLEQEHRGFKDRFDRLLVLMGAKQL